MATMRYIRVKLGKTKPLTANGDVTDRSVDQART